MPEDRKALPEVPTSVQLELDQLGEDLRSSLQGLDSDIIGVARREQEEISRCCNWAGYRAYPRLPCHQNQRKAPPEHLPRSPSPPCTVKVFLDRSGTSSEDVTFVLGLESYYAADPRVSNSYFREEFLVVDGFHGMHVVTLVPLGEVPYSPDGLPTVGVVLPLGGPHSAG